MSEAINLRTLSEVFVTLFVIMDPPGTIPVFLALTNSMTVKQRNKAARQAVLVSFGVIVVFAVFGQQILNFMHISMAALQVSGGLLLLLIALELLVGKSEEPHEAGDRVNVAMVPLGTPLMAGPGAIVATIVAVQGAGGNAANWVAVSLGIVGVHLCLYLAMRFSSLIHRVLGDSGTTLVTRIAGLLLAAIAVQMMADGVFAFIAQNT